MKRREFITLLGRRGCTRFQIVSHEAGAIDILLIHLPTQVALGRLSLPKMWLVALGRMLEHPCRAQLVRSPAAVSR